MIPVGFFTVTNLLGVVAAADGGALMATVLSVVSSGVDDRLDELSEEDERDEEEENQSVKPISARE